MEIDEIRDFAIDSLKKVGWLKYYDKVDIKKYNCYIFSGIRKPFVGCMAGFVTTNNDRIRLRLTKHFDTFDTDTKKEIVLHELAHVVDYKLRGKSALSDPDKAHDRHFRKTMNKLGSDLMSLKVVYLPNPKNPIWINTEVGGVWFDRCNR